MNVRLALLAPAAALAVGASVPASTASAALVTRCDGEAADVSIPGDLVVPAGASCTLTRTTIEGSVTVRAGADLLLIEDSSVGGGVAVNADGFVELVDVAVAGSVVGRNPFSIILDATEVAGDVSIRGTIGNVFDATLYTLGAIVDGAVSARGSEVFLESTTVAGPVEARDGVLTDIDDSTLLGSLRVRGNELGSIVCESEIDGDAVFVGNAYGLQIGGPGTTGSCTGASYWGGSVTIANNTGEEIGIDVSNTIVRGSLGGDGNDPAPTGSGNRVRGGVSGQFADLQPAAAADAEVARTAAASVDTTSRIDADGAIAARRAQALHLSAAAGAAFD